jgi:hypothetical protein
VTLLNRWRQSELPAVVRLQLIFDLLNFDLFFINAEYDQLFLIDALSLSLPNAKHCYFFFSLKIIPKSALRGNCTFFLLVTSSIKNFSNINISGRNRLPVRREVFSIISPYLEN